MAACFSAANPLVSLKFVYVCVFLHRFDHFISIKYKSSSGSLQKFLHMQTPSSFHFETLG